MLYLDKFISIWGNENFQYNRSLEGTDNYVFGCNAGGRKNIFNLTHEVAHFIQVSQKEFKKKYVDGHLIFNVKKIWVYNRYCVEMETDQASRRELETFVIQHFIHSTFEDITLKQFFDKYEIYNLFSWLPDTFNFHEDAFNTSDAFKVWCLNEAKKIQEVKCLDEIKKIWFKRMKTFKPKQTKSKSS